MTRKYTASIIGAGAGGQLSLTALAASKRFEPVAVTDLSDGARSNTESDYPHVRTFASHEQMFEQCPSDVVVVATYPPSHLPLTLAALNLPLKGIVVEKPLGDTAEAGRGVLAAIKARSLPVAVPHGLLVLPHATQMISRVRSGEIGDLLIVDIRFTGWDILNAGIHWVNFFVMLTGLEPMDFVLAACDTSTRTYRDGAQVETLGVTYAQTRSGVRLVMNSGDDVNVGRQGKDALFNIAGTDGSIEFYGWEGTYRLVNNKYPNGKVFTVDASDRTSHQIHLENLADQMDRGEPDYAVAESSLMALEICEASYLSHRHRCTVKLPLVGFTPPASNDWDPGTPYAGTGGGRDGRNL